MAGPILETEGMPVFDLLRYQQHDRAAVLCAFDLIELDGEDLRRSPLEHRKRALAKLLRQKRDGIVLNAHYVGDGATIYKHACTLGCEGIRSLATYRVRIALNLKGVVPDEVVDVNLLKGAQREAAAYRAVNPMMALPALIDGEGPILFEVAGDHGEPVNETHPNPPLVPRDARGRARVRGLAQIIACDSHPLIVPRVREYLEHEFKLNEPTRIN